MALKEPKSMTEVHEWRRQLLSRAKGKNLRQKLIWISKQAKMLGVPEEFGRLRKAS